MEAVLLFVTTLLLGLRHGIDWDHIAAISDITTSTDDKKESFLLGTMYALGHGFVIVALGISAVAFGVKLPAWVDAVMEPFIGLTLVFMGLYLAFSIIRHGKNVRLKSRWMMLFTALRKAYDTVEHAVTHKHSHSHFHYPDKFGVTTAWGVGMMHGIGAETPTQLLLFVAATGAGGRVLGSMVVITFVVGLVLSNTLIIALSILGISKAKQNSNIYLFLAGITAVFSFALGMLYLTGGGEILPSIL